MLSTKIAKKIGRNLFGNWLRITLVFRVSGEKHLGKAGIFVGKQILPKKKKKSFDITGADNGEI